jgi:hypothetical protein
MNIIFSTPWAAISAECGTKFPTYSHEDAAKQLLFSRLRDAGRTPVRYLQVSGNDTMYTLLLDVPTVTNIDQVDAEVLPYTCAAE